jgi:hypothetical protein
MDKITGRRNRTVWFVMIATREASCGLRNGSYHQLLPQIAEYDRDIVLAPGGNLDHNHAPLGIDGGQDSQTFIGFQDKL